MRQFRARIEANIKVSRQWRLLGFRWPQECPPPRPGQFYTFLPNEGRGDSLLRRPLAFSGYEAPIAYSLYQLRGSATTWLSTVKRGQSLDLLAPLGNSFPKPERGQQSLIVGGGVGIGPMLFFLASLMAEGSRPGEDFISVMGFKSATTVPDDSVFPKAMAEAFRASIISTDDGTRGFHGTALDAIDSASARFAEKSVYYACGPTPMLAEIQTRAEKRDIPAFISVEQWMACGVGACHGCVLPARNGTYLRACADGPVFNARALDFNRKAHV